MGKIISLLAAMESFCSLNGVTEKEISEAEKNLNVKFADEYREYLLKYGLASIDGHEFTGIVASDRLNVVSITNLLRPKFNGSLDRYVLEELNIDHIVIWQNSVGEVYQAIPYEEMIKIADSLVEYLNLLK